jgi:2-iminobutanoate/2-iminopropanoate deaminase
MQKHAINAGLPSIGLPFSWGVRLGDLIFLAGQGPLGKDGKVIEGDIRVQTQETLENFRRVVEAAGSDLDHVLSTTVYLRSLEDFRGMNEVYSEYFSKEPRPARATVQAELLFGMKVEIQGIAFAPEAKDFNPPLPSGTPMAKRKKSKKAAKKKAYYSGRKERRAKK